ncbi:MAG: CRTAC1 family protein [Bryobacteraceae bacterium]
MKRRFLFICAFAAIPVGLLGWQEVSAIKFEEIGKKAGVQFRHHTRIFSGPHADVLRMFTSGGASAAAGDFDGDGLDDLFITDSDNGKPNRLFRNNGNATFTDVTDKAGVAGGNEPNTIVADALWFDYDNDGKQDLLVARFGTPLLYHNEGAGKFKDVSKATGINRFGNTIAAVAFDYDNDGWLDVMFGNYFKSVNLLEGKDDHVLPNDLDNAINGGGVTLWHNNHNGSFTDVTSKAGFDKHTGWTLDIGHADLNNDGRQDVYLACDYGTDRIYFNNGDGTFRDATEKAIGTDTRKGMNVDIADYDNDGWFDIYVTNITDEYMKECNMLWHNNHDGTFTDVSKETNTCATLWGWSAKFGDYDNDGWQDLFVVNGLRSGTKDNYIPVLLDMITRPGVDFTDVKNWPNIGEMTWSGYQKKKFLHNLGGETFKEISAQAGVDNEMDGRGLAISDFDRDGKLDIYQANADQNSLLYRNISTGAGNWTQIDLRGTKSNRDAIGARITVVAGGRPQIQEVNGGNGYAGQSSHVAHFGIGKAAKIDEIQVKWPSGMTTKVAAPPMNKKLKIVEGQGLVAN